MPSDHPVLIRTIDKVLPHPNADKLDLYHVEGWQCISAKLDDGSPRYKEGERVVFFPPDTAIPDKLAEVLGVEKYLKRRRDEHGNEVGVVGQIRLRGEMTFGVLTDASRWFPVGEDGDKFGYTVGSDVSEFFGVSKYVRPIHPENFGGANRLRGPRLSEHPGFSKYTDINNWRNYSKLIEPGEQVVVTEKLHGTNSRVGVIDGAWMAGSHRVRRQPPRGWQPKVPYKIPLRSRIWNALAAFGRKLLRSKEPPIDASDLTYWAPLDMPGVQDLVLAVQRATGARQVILYGEIVGAEVQPLHYGYGPNSERGRFGYYLFDIKVDGHYWPWCDVKRYAGSCGVKLAPVLFEGPYDAAHCWKFASGKTTLETAPGESHVREGVVVKPVFPRTDPRVGRVILKMISDEYLILIGKEPRFDAVQDV